MESSYGRYRALESLRRGAATELWRGRDPDGDRVVGIVVLRAAGGLPAELHDSYCQAFLAVAGSAGKLRHPGLVAILDFGVADDGLPFLVTELVEGMSLRDELARTGPIEVAAAARIGQTMAAALGVLHGAGLVHGDVCPANLLRAADGSVRLTGHGIPVASAAAQAADARLAASPYYGSPEAAAGREIGPASDLFSLGVTVFALVTGKHPFARPTPAESRRALLHAPAPTASSARAELGPGWDALFGSVLSKEPEDRHPDAGALAEAFAGRLPRLPSDVRTVEMPMTMLLELVVIEGPDRGARIPLGERVEIGREAGQLRLTDSTVSRRHCRLERVGERVVLTDLGSRNGTWLPSGRIREAELSEGGVFAVGSNTKVRLSRFGSEP